MSEQNDINGQGENAAGENAAVPGGAAGAPHTTPDAAATPPTAPVLPTTPVTQATTGAVPPGTPVATAPPARPFWSRTGARVGAGIIAAVLILGIGFGGGWAAHGMLRPFGGHAQAWGPDGDRGMMHDGFGGQRAPRDGRQGDGFNGQRPGYGNGNSGGSNGSGGSGSSPTPTPSSTPGS